MDTIAERSHPVNQFFVDLYNFLLRHHQDWMKYYYWFLNVTKPNDSPLGYLLAKPFLHKLLEKEPPSVMVSVHPMLNHYLARSRADLGLSDRVKLIVVVTDPNKELWKGWACEDADLTIVPNDLARDQLIEWGVAPERIRVMGMPVHPEFLRAPVKSKKDFLTSVGLDPDILTVCINSGWAGGGNMMKIYDKLALVKRPLQALFLCGHNNALCEQAQAAADSSPVKTRVLPFYDSMAVVMNACDLMVTKAGGLTTFEAIARRLPIAFDTITEPMPQERGTIDILLEQGLAHAVRNPEDIVPIVESLQLATDREQQPLPVAHSLDQTHAAYNIATLILSACEPSYDLVRESPPVWTGEVLPAWDHSVQLGLEGT